MNDISAKAIGYALVALLTSGLLLSAVFFLHLLEASPFDSQRLYIPGKDFRPVLGQASTVGENLVVTGFADDGPNQRAIVSLWRALDSNAFRFVSVTVEQGAPDLEASLFWRSAQDADALFRQPLPGPGSVGNTIDMSLNPQWVGDIAEIGLVLSFRSEAAPVILAGVTLETSGTDSALRGLVTQWTAFRKFDQKTINRLSATFSAGALSPVALAAAWVALALILAGAVSRWGSTVPSFTYLAVVLIAWVVLDLLWQRQLSGQLEITRHLFHDKSMAERHAHDIDSTVYQHAMELKEEALPAEPVRLFILHDSHKQNYLRLRMQYYLLPHNIYNLSRFPPETVGEGDYLLALGHIPSLEYDAEASLLKWRDGAVLPVGLVHSHQLGTLYLIGERTPQQPAGTREVLPQ